MWIGRRSEPHELLRLLEKHLVRSAFCPSRHCLSLGELVASAFQHLCAGTHALLWLPGSGYLAKERQMIRCLLEERVGSVFSHSALSLSIHPGLPENWKNTYKSFTYIHCLSWCPKHTHTHTLVLHITAMVQIWNNSGQFLISWRVQEVPAAQWRQPLILSPLIVFQSQGKGGI